MKDPLEKLFLLFEQEMKTQKEEPPVANPEALVSAVNQLSNQQPSKGKTKTPKSKPPIQEPEVNREPPPKAHDIEAPDTIRKREIRTLVKAGAKPEEAHQDVAGPVDTYSTASRASLAQTLGQVHDDNLKGGVSVEKGSQSFLAQDKEVEEKEDQISPTDLRTPQDEELPDELQGSQGSSAAAPESAVGASEMPAGQSSPEETEQKIQRLERNFKQEYSPEELQAMSSPTQGELTPEQQQSEQESKDFIIRALDTMLTSAEKKRGAGANELSRTDIESFQRYIREGLHSNVQKQEISDEDLDFAMDYLKQRFKGKERIALMNSLKNKGDPPREMKVAARGREVLRSYLSFGGLSAVTGEPLPFSESQLDHMTSLDNGGVDGADNWAWMERRFNQTKKALSDEELLEKLQQMLNVNPDDARLKSMENELRNTIRGEWNSYFKRKGWNNVTQADIRAAKGTNGMQMLKALAEVAGVSHYEDRGMTRSTGRAGGGKSLVIDKLKERLIDELNIPDEDQLNKFDEEMIALLQNLEDKSVEVGSFKKELSRQKRQRKRSVQECYLEWILETKFNYYVNPDKITYLVEEEELDTETDWDYNDDVKFLQTFGNA